MLFSMPNVGLHTGAGTVSSLVGWMGSCFPQGQCTKEELETRLLSTHDREILFTFIAITVSHGASCQLGPQKCMELCLISSARVPRPSCAIGVACPCVI